MTKYGLVADVGGTNVRFGLVDLGTPLDLSLQSPRKLVSREHASLAEAARFYLADLRLDTSPAAAVFAVAGPVQDGQISMTNLGWHFTADELRASLHIDRVAFINDYEAIALSAPQLGPADLIDIGPSPPTGTKARETIAIVGPGTGLGVVGYLRTQQGIAQIVTEGGHADFAPLDELEIEIFRFLRRRYDHVSAERILSGPGLTNLHEAMAAIAGRPSEPLGPHEITARAEKDATSFCGEVLGRFCAIMGSVCGNIALIMGARDGVLIAGGILPAVAKTFAASAFRERFEAKGRFRDYMKAIPTRLIVQQYTGLMGAAAALQGSAFGASRND